MPNKDQVASAVRWVVTTAGAYAVVKGVGDAAMWQSVAGGVAALAAFAWSMWVHA